MILSLSPTRQTDKGAVLSSIKVEQVEVRCGYTVEVVLNYFNHAPQKTTYLFSD